MKLILASQGFTTPDIAKAVETLVNKPLKEINISIINESYVGIPANEDKRWLINELSLIPKYIGGTIDFINLRAYSIDEIRERLSNTDLIYIVGGSLLVLPKILKETGFDLLLKKLIDTKVIMGTSAGAMVLGKQVESSEYWKECYEEDINNIVDKQLEVVNFNIIPHYLREDRKEYTYDFYNRFLSNNPFLIYAINDEQAVIYDNGNISFVGGSPVVFGKEKQKQ